MYCVCCVCGGVLGCTVYVLIGYGKVGERVECGGGEGGNISTLPTNPTIEYK